MKKESVEELDMIRQWSDSLIISPTITKPTDLSLKKQESSTLQLTTSNELSKSYCRHKNGFFEGCNRSCSCLEIILDKEETEEMSTSKITVAKNIEDDTYDFMRLMD